MQRVNIQFVFVNNVQKRCIELFHQLGLIVLYKSLRHSLQLNTKAVMDLIIEKMRSQQFFILYDNINFYENVRNQRIFNCNALLNYTIRYICFMKINNHIEDGTDSWEEQYIDNSQIDQKLVNDLINEDFELIQANQIYCLVAI